MATPDPERKPARTVSRFAGIAALVVALIVAALAASLLIENQAIVGAEHRRNYRQADVAVRALETWARDVEAIANRQYRATTPYVDLSSQDWGSYRIEFGECALLWLGPAGDAPSGERKASSRFIPSSLPGEGAHFEIVSRLAAGGGKRCFRVRVPLDALLKHRFQGSLISHLLIVARDGRIVQQVGAKRLPLDTLKDFAPGDSLGQGLLAELTNSTPKDAERTPLSEVSNVVPLTAGGVRYLAYVKPIDVPAPDVACVQTAAVPANVRASLFSRCYAVAVMPASALRRPWLSAPPVVLVSFGLLLLALVGAMPLLRLFAAGGTESLTPIEIAGIVLGLAVTVAMTTFALLFADRVLAEREAAGPALRKTSHAMATRAANTIHAAVREMVRFGSARPPAGSCSADRGKATCMSRASGSPPLLETIHFVNANGVTAPDMKRLAAQPKAAQYIEVQDRAYFRDIVAGRGRLPRRPVERARSLEGSPPGGQVRTDAGVLAREPRACFGPEDEGKVEYTLAQVRSQTDGRPKAVIAARCTRAGEARFAIAAFELDGFTREMLPPNQRFLVIDAESADFSVLLYEGRVPGVETTAGALGLEAADLVRTRELIARALAENGRGAVAVRFHGEMVRAAAAPVPNSSWVVMVWSPEAAIDAPGTLTAARALAGWGVIVLMAVLLVLLLFGVVGISLRSFWPHEEARSAYRYLFWRLLAVAVAASVPMLLMPALSSVCAAGLIIAAMTFTAVALHRVPDTDDALSPITERYFLRTLMAFYLCVGGLPAYGLWSDARPLAKQLLGAQAVDRASADYRSLKASDPLISSAPSAPEQRMFEAPLVPAESMRPAAEGARGFSAWLWEQQFGVPVPPVASCVTSRSLCRASGGVTFGIGPDFASAPSNWLRIVALVVVALLLAWVFYRLLDHGLRALAGFGVPLGAVKWPRLRLPIGKRADGEVPARLLLIAPQSAVVERLMSYEGTSLIDVADLLLDLEGAALSEASVKALTNDQIKAAVDQASAGRAPVLLASGLELLLRDGPRRRAALKMLEVADQSFREGRLRRLVIVAEMSPLERILDAFQAQSSDSEVLTTREELRWARLFQNFTTAWFAPVDKIGSEPFDGLKLAQIQLAEELRWLPGHVISSVIGCSPPPSQANTVVDFSLENSWYQVRYRELIVRWSQTVEVGSEPAAIDFMRSMLIEHYEQCWAASSQPERIVLDAIARGRFVNMRRALALQSLVRRGLVVLDPSPRLMNQSFALFVRQAERPNTLAEWRRLQRAESGLASRLSTALFVPVALVVLAAAAADAGQDLSTILSVLAASAPALLGLGARTLRQGL